MADPNLPADLQPIRRPNPLRAENRQLREENARLRQELQQLRQEQTGPATVPLTTLLIIICATIVAMGIGLVAGFARGWSAETVVILTFLLGLTGGGALSTWAIRSSKWGWGVGALFLAAYMFLLGGAWCTTIAYPPIALGLNKIGAGPGKIRPIAAPTSEFYTISGKKILPTDKVKEGYALGVWLKDAKAGEGGIVLPAPDGYDFQNEEDVPLARVYLFDVNVPDRASCKVPIVLPKPATPPAAGAKPKPGSKV